jgi:hypothetical protein
VWQQIITTVGRAFVQLLHLWVITGLISLTLLLPDDILTANMSMPQTLIVDVDNRLPTSLAGH